jgi:activating signal cointegrator complex subunit 1
MFELMYYVPASHSCRSLSCSFRRLVAPCTRSTIAFLWVSFGSSSFQTSALTATAIRVAPKAFTHLPLSLIFSKPLTPPPILHPTHLTTARLHSLALVTLIMGKKKASGEYNDFVDGEKLRDNAEPRTTLNGSTTTTREVPPPPVHQDRKGSKRHGKGKGKSGPKKPRLTHFLCLPLVTELSRPQLQAGLEKLKRDLSTQDLVPIKAVRPVGTLHLTLGVMSLDSSTLEAAKLLLQNLNLHNLLRDITIQAVAQQAAEDGIISENMASLPDTEAIKIYIEGLVPMQTPQKTSILYAAPKDKTERLMLFASALRERFIEKGLLIEDTRPLKLHATIINTVYAKPGGRRGTNAKPKGTPETVSHQDGKKGDEHNDNASTANSTEDGHSNEVKKNEGHGPEAQGWMRFDARSLIDEYKDFSWARDVKIDRVQICKMGAEKIWSSGVEGEGEVVDERYEVICEKSIDD